METIVELKEGEFNGKQPKGTETIVELKEGEFNGKQPKWRRP